VHNGLLLSALWDAAFDAGLISFADDGALLTAVSLSPAALAALASSSHHPVVIVLTPAHRMNMRRHRAKHGPWRWSHEGYT
jgi:putative restriction endonuclease